MIEKTYQITLSVEIKATETAKKEETPAIAEIVLKVGHNFIKHLDRNQLFVSMDAAITAALITYEETNVVNFKLHPHHLKNMNDHMDRFPDFIEIKPC